MAVSYANMYHLMIYRGISSAELKDKTRFIGNIFTHIKRNEYIYHESIEKICQVLNCRVVEFCSRQ